MGCGMKAAASDWVPVIRSYANTGASEEFVKGADARGGAGRPLSMTAIQEYRTKNGWITQCLRSAQYCD